MGGANSWRSDKQVGIANSTMEARSIVTMEAFWLNNFLMDKSLVSSMQMAVTMVIAEQLQERRNLASMR